MTQQEFEKAFEHINTICRNTLIHKAKEYAKGGDRLHNFKVGASFTGETPVETLWGFMVKHLVCIADFVQTGDAPGEVLETRSAVWTEKIVDSINYLYLMYASLIDSGLVIGPEFEKVDSSELGRSIEDPLMSPDDLRNVCNIVHDTGARNKLREIFGCEKTNVEDKLFVVNDEVLNIYRGLSDGETRENIFDGLSDRSHLSDISLILYRYIATDPTLDDASQIVAISFVYHWFMGNIEKAQTLLKHVDMPTLVHVVGQTDWCVNGNDTKIATIRKGHFVVDPDCEIYFSTEDINVYWDDKSDLLVKLRRFYGDGCLVDLHLSAEIRENLKKILPTFDK